MAKVKRSADGGGSKPLAGKGARRIRDIYSCLFGAFGPQGWWPGETPFEVAVGAILTQNTNWSNVERAIARLKARDVLSPRKMYALSSTDLADLIRPAGYFNVKARRLMAFLAYLKESSSLSMKRLATAPPAILREELLAVRGIGPETADSILLYAAGHPSFVVDAYTKRIFSRHRIVGPAASYGDIKSLFEDALVADVRLFNEYHALIVRTGKDFCRPRTPRCAGCPLLYDLQGGPAGVVC